MKNGDVRGACFALLRSRLGGEVAGRGTSPVALGSKLAGAEASAAELATLCASLISRHERLGASVDWPRSPLLRAFLEEYRRVQVQPATPTRDGNRPVRACAPGRGPERRADC